VKNAIRIAALLLLVVFSASGSTRSIIVKPPCICPDVYNPACDAAGNVYPNACVCRCKSPVPGTCVGGC
jgi:hypothetical protein